MSIILLAFFLTIHFFIHIYSYLFFCLCFLFGRWKEALEILREMEARDDVAVSKMVDACTSCVDYCSWIFAPLATQSCLAFFVRSGKTAANELSCIFYEQELLGH